MPLPPTFIPIYTRQPQVDPLYRRYGLDDMSSGVSAGAALEYAQKFSGGAALGRAAQLMEARGQTPTDPLVDMPSPFSPGTTTAELFQQQQAAELMGEAPTPAVTPSAPAYPDVTMRPPKALSPLLQPEELNKRYGVEGRLKFDKPEYQEAAELLHEWAIDDVTREDRLARADQDIGSQAIRLGAGLVGSMLDPLNVASAFLPVIPEAMFASAMAKTVGFGARSALRLGRGAAEGFAGAALLEPIVYYQSQAEQADYGMWDVLANLAFGTVLGGGLHAGGGAVADAVGRLRWSERAEIMRGAVGQFVDRGEVTGIDAVVPTRSWRETVRAADGTIIAERAVPEPEIIMPTRSAVEVGTDLRAEMAAKMTPEEILRLDRAFSDFRKTDETPSLLGKSYVELKESVTVYRGGPNEEYVMRSQGEISTSATPKVAETFASPAFTHETGAYAEITLQPGVKVSAVDAAHEALEFVLAPGTRLEVTARDTMTMKNGREVPKLSMVARPAAADGAARAAPAVPIDRAAAVRASLAPSSETVADLHSAAVMADTVAKAPKADTAEQGIAAIQKDMATLDEQLQSIGPEVPERTTAEGAEAAPQYAAWLDASDRAYLAEADDMIAQAAAKADVARVAALCGLGVG